MQTRGPVARLHSFHGKSAMFSFSKVLSSVLWALYTRASFSTMASTIPLCTDAFKSASSIFNSPELQTSLCNYPSGGTIAHARSHLKQTQLHKPDSSLPFKSSPLFFHWNELLLAQKWEAETQTSPLLTSCFQRVTTPWCNYLPSVSQIHPLSPRPSLGIPWLSPTVSLQC